MTCNLFVLLFFTFEFSFPLGLERVDVGADGVDEEEFVIDEPDGAPESRLDVVRLSISTIASMSMSGSSPRNEGVSV